LLLVVLPDGSRSLIPAWWTDLAAMPVAEPAVATEDPDFEFLGSGSSVLGSSDMIATEMEQVVDLIVG
jgi:hypothetical protein